jgi:kynureninase
MSNAPIFSMAVHKVALDLFTEVGMDALRKKSIALTAFLEYVLNEVEKATGQTFRIITPSDPAARGCQLSVIVEGQTKALVQKLADHGIIVDWREPNVIRLAPVPMYNSFEDVYQLGQRLIQLLK